MLTMILAISTANAAMQAITKEQAMQILAQSQEQPNITYKNSQNLPTLLVFYTTWCGYCKQITPSVDKLAEEFKGKIFVKKVNIESNEGKALAKTNKIGGAGVPHIQIYSAKGALVRNELGYQTYESLKEEIKLFI